MCSNLPSTFPQNHAKSLCQKTHCSPFDTREYFAKWGGRRLIRSWEVRLTTELVHFIEMPFPIRNFSATGTAECVTYCHCCHHLTATTEVSPRSPPPLTTTVAKLYHHSPYQQCTTPRGYQWRRVIVTHFHMNWL